MKAIRKISIEGAVSLIRLYQLAISPFLGARCRFYPSCSHYLCESIRKRGLLRGLGKGLIRLAKCHPFHPGGYDPI